MNVKKTCLNEVLINTQRVDFRKPSVSQCFRHHRERLTWSISFQFLGKRKTRVKCTPFELSIFSVNGTNSKSKSLTAEKHEKSFCLFLHNRISSITEDASKLQKNDYSHAKPLSHGTALSNTDTSGTGLYVRLTGRFRESTKRCKECRNGAATNSRSPFYRGVL